MTIAPGEGAQNPAYRREFQLFMLLSSWLGRRQYRFISVGELCVFFLLPLLLSRDAQAQTASRWDLHVWQCTVLQPQDDDFNRSRAKAGLLSFAPVTVYLKVRLKLEKMTPISDGVIHWKVFLQDLDFSLDDYKSPIFLPWSTRPKRDNKILMMGVHRIVKHLHDAPLEVLRDADGQILDVKDIGFSAGFNRAVQQISPSNREAVSSQLLRFFDKRQWEIILSAQTPNFSPTRQLGETWIYTPSILLPGIKDSKGAKPEGASRVLSVDTQSGQIDVSSFANVHLKALSSGGGFDYFSTIIAHTTYGKQREWPLEHFATERGSYGIQTYIPTTDSNFYTQTHLIAHPLS